MSSRISRRGVFAIGAGLPVAFMDTASAQTPVDATAQPTFSLLLVNDIYRMSDVKGRGGFPRLAAIVKAERARGVPMLFCHAGDCFSPSLLSGFDQGEHIVDLTNLIPPDVFVPGNHEFDFGKDIYLKRMAEARFPFFGANMSLADGSPVPGMKSSELYRFGEVTVGLVGLVMEEVPQVSSPGDLRFGPVMETLRREAESLRAKGADILVAVAHTERSVDLEIVRSGLVDILLTGHDHDLAITFDGRTVMVESNEEGNFVTAIDVVARAKGTGLAREVSWTPSFRVHDSAKVEPDPGVARVVATYESNLSSVLDVVVAKNEFQLDSRTSVIRSQETATGNLVAETIREMTGADVALINAGAIRGNAVFAPGSVLRRRELLTELPFANIGILLELSGQDLVAVLEHGLSSLPDPQGRFPQIAGMRFTYNPREPVGRRVKSVEIGGAPLDPVRRYRFGSTHFLLGGGDGYAMLPKATVLIGQNDGKLVPTEVMNRVAEKGVVTARIDGRIAVM
ncbi:bifunctional metallophosphatase/5'-nucleotidase [Enterovirga rhinocerotis]|uniref:2',3'-cyclic-nucleotide 2'-phosphodiesterase (5'-nucleotidase family) n=1 Tax=Enterovirga rhinocerotis TaxID=1339210 RepID=A0A4R7BX22_9HYPH|nr:bifunctional UDP-sugar hydrolase/5'-nucleotidase [Enterovirga rhinocerotis]TDR90053.1 2',3'-cyclic-nucleotide 2'-phosphodiesterase (5'-nucleotidase family) [Enterovirga rhinocerotis]